VFRPVITQVLGVSVFRPVITQVLGVSVFRPVITKVLGVSVFRPVITQVLCVTDVLRIMKTKMNGYDMILLTRDFKIVDSSTDFPTSSPMFHYFSNFISFLSIDNLKIDM
jgi:hypothetical protein